jgi:prepilin-type N-terminal cleavage/methylation domain-containing protein/prepilin-type processing-associated H-X9-DG protein
MTQARSRTSRRAFTLIEVLVVITVIGLLIALTLAAVNQARESGRRIQCVNNLKQIGLALQNYHSAMSVFPPAYISLVEDFVVDQGPGWGWGAMILPQLDNGSIYNAINFNLDLLALDSQTVRQTNVSVFLCPSSPQGGPVLLQNSINGDIMVDDLAPGQYVGSHGQGKVDKELSRSGGIFHRNISYSVRDISDGSTLTLMVGERSRNLADATWVGVPRTPAYYCTNPNWPIRDCGFGRGLILAHTGPSTPSTQLIFTPNSKSAGMDCYWSLHAGGCNFLFCDGSVRFIRESIHPQTFAALATRSNNEPVSDDQL